MTFTEMNMSEKAKEIGRENWLRYLDTFGDFEVEEIISYDSKGYDLIMVVYPDNTFCKWRWVKR